MFRSIDMHVGALHVGQPQLSLQPHVIILARRPWEHMQVQYHEHGPVAKGMFMHAAPGRLERPSMHYSSDRPCPYTVT